MKKVEKIGLLNTIHRKIFDWDCDGDSCSRVTMKLDEEARNVLSQLGISDSYIQLKQKVNGDGTFELDIAPIGFQICEAVWWDPFMGFMEERP
ncbi:hypothetical protein SMD22_00365 (plasmid) [Brevibacillus halotolerans]|nr:hypothetical protein SMD22_00365 [Brevibacillus halotolerans]